MSKSKKYYYRVHQLHQYLTEVDLEACEIRIYQKGEKICEMDSKIDGLYFFVEGKAMAYFSMENGRQLLLTFHEPFKLFGDLEILEEEPIATSTVEAFNTCVCLVLERSYVQQHLINEPEFLKALSKSLGKKLGRVIRNSAMNLLNPLENRVASYILATSESGIFSGNLTRIAEQLGTSFRHLHRTLQGFCGLCILEKRGTQYMILNEKALREKAAGVYIID